MTEKEKEKAMTAPTEDVFKKRAIRYAKLNQLHEPEKQTQLPVEVNARSKCLSCLWHYECDNVCGCGCEDYQA